jgi:hypothetical protein
MVNVMRGGGRAPPTLTSQGQFYPHDLMYARKQRLLLCILCEQDFRTVQHVLHVGHSKVEIYSVQHAHGMGSLSPVSYRILFLHPWASHVASHLSVSVSRLHAPVTRRIQLK